MLRGVKSVFMQPFLESKTHFHALKSSLGYPRHCHIFVYHFKNPPYNDFRPILKFVSCQFFVTRYNSKEFAPIALKILQAYLYTFYTILCIKCVFSIMCLGYKIHFKNCTILKRGRMHKNIFMLFCMYFKNRQNA